MTITAIVVTLLAIVGSYFTGRSRGYDAAYEEIFPTFKTECASEVIDEAYVAEVETPEEPEPEPEAPVVTKAEKPRKVKVVLSVTKAPVASTKKTVKKSIKKNARKSK